MSALASMLKRSSVPSALLRTLQPTRSLHASVCVRAAPMDRAALLRKASDARSSPISSRAPRDADAAAAPAADAGAASAADGSERPRKPLKPAVETWPETRVEQICNDVLRDGRAALAALQAKGQAAPAAGGLPLAVFNFPRLNSFERHVVHKTAERVGGAELAHASFQVGSAKYISLEYVPPTTTQ